MKLFAMQEKGHGLWYKWSNLSVSYDEGHAVGAHITLYQHAVYDDE